MATADNDREVQQFLADLLVASGHEVETESRFRFADGSPIIADLVAITPDGDLVVFEIGKPSPDKLRQLDRFEQATGLRPRLVDPAPLAAAIASLRRRDTRTALKQINAGAPWYVRLKGAAKGASNVLGKSIKAVLGRIKVVELTFGHKFEVTQPDGTVVKTTTGVNARLELRDHEDRGVGADHTE